MRLAVALGVATVLAWSGAAAQIDVDNRDVKVDPSAPGTPEYEKTIEERNRKAREDAERRGGTHIDTTYGEFGPAPPATGRPALPEGREPAAVKPRLAEREPVGGVQTPAAVPGPDRVQADYGRSDQVGQGELRQLLGELLQALDRQPEVVRLRASERQAGRAGERRAEVDASPPARADGFPAVPVGSGVYGRVLYAVNSDFSGPVMIELLEPPLVGAVLSGGFERVRDRLVLRMRRLSWRGRDAAVEAWGVGLDCACYGVGGEVDRHWWERLVLPAAVRFAEGWLTAKGTAGRRVQVSGETVVEERARPTDRETVYAGLARAARSAGDLLLEDAPAAPTVRIPRNTEVAVVFARPPGETVSTTRAAAPDSRGPSGAGVVRVGVEGRAGPAGRGPGGPGAEDRPDG